MILYLTDPTLPDYGSDYLFDGFRELFGVTTIDFPLKPSLHGKEQASFDCDLAWSGHQMNLQAVEDHLAMGSWDLMVISTLRGPIPQLVTDWARRGLLKKVRDRIVAYDAEDDTVSRHPLYQLCLGFPPAAEFKRELPLGESWARPLPFGYPARRVVSTVELRPARVVYAVQQWDSPIGAQRAALGDLLRAELGDYADASVYRDGNRPTVVENHERNRRARIAVVPAGAGWGTNRYLEVVADGCVLVAEEPTVQMPYALIDGVECRTYRSMSTCIDVCRDLIVGAGLAQMMASRGRAALLRYHTTRVRAQTVWEAVHGCRSPSVTHGATGADSVTTASGDSRP